MLISILILIINKSIIYIVMIGADAYCTTSKLKKNQGFAVLIRNFKFQVVKETKLEIHLKIVISKEYHNLLDLFSKLGLYIFLSHQKYDHKNMLKRK